MTPFDDDVESLGAIVPANIAAVQIFSILSFEYFGSFCPKFTCDRSGRRTKTKHLWWASSKRRKKTAGRLTRALKYWCLALFMALIREEQEKMGHSGSCRPNSLFNYLFVYLSAWADCCQHVCESRLCVRADVLTCARRACFCKRLEDF